MLIKTGVESPGQRVGQVSSKLLRILICLILLHLLVGCRPGQLTDSSSHGEYLTNSTYYGWSVGSVWFNSSEHLYNISDSLVTHSMIYGKEIIEKEYRIDKIKYRGKNKSIYFASNINAAFVFDRKNRSMNVFSYNMNLHTLHPIPLKRHFGLIKVQKYDPPQNQRFNHIISRMH